MSLSHVAMRVQSMGLVLSQQIIKNTIDIIYHLSNDNNLVFDVLFRLQVELNLIKHNKAVVGAHKYNF